MPRLVIAPGRTEEDTPHELLLRFGLDLRVPIETRTKAGKFVHAVGAGTSLARLDQTISHSEVKPLALDIGDWHDIPEPAGESIVVCRDSAFTNDVAKTKLAAILEQRGLGGVRSS